MVNPMSVTIKDIAREAGVSYASVSRALSGSRGVSLKTAQRILAVAKELNYSPNGIARNLVNQHSKTIGLIVPDISNPFFADIALSVIHTAEKAGYQTILSNSDWEPRAQERQLQLMREQRVDGVILKPVQDAGDDVAYESLGLPAVLLHYSGSKVVSCVDTDHEYGGYLITCHLLGCGCNRIAFIGGLPDSRSNLQRLEGYTRALREAGLAPEDRLVRHGPFTSESGYALTRELLERPAPPDALFCGNDVIALGALQYAQEAGISVPRELCIAGFDGISYASLAQIRLTTIRQDRQRMGETATHLLLDAIEANAAPTVQKILLTPTLLAQATTGKRKPPAETDERRKA